MPSHPQYVPDLCTGLSTRAGTLRGPLVTGLRRCRRLSTWLSTGAARWHEHNVVRGCGTRMGLADQEHIAFTANDEMIERAGGGHR